MHELESFISVIVLIDDCKNIMKETRTEKDEFVGYTCFIIWSYFTSILIDLYSEMKTNLDSFQ